MRSLLIVLIFCGLLCFNYSRPAQLEEGNDSDLEEAEYGNESAAEDNMREEDIQPNTGQEVFQREEVGPNRQYADVNDALYQQRAVDMPAHTDAEKISDYKPRHRDARKEKYYDSNEESQPVINSGQSNRYMENNDANSIKPSRMQNSAIRNQVDRRIIEANSNEEGDLLFENKGEPLNLINNNEYKNNEAPDSSERSQYFKQYYNTMQADDKAVSEDKNLKTCRLNLNRDTRQVQELNPKEDSNFPNPSNGKDALQKTDNEDEEAAIKRHIKKLSGDELEDLLNSLSDEKRVLLKKIIDNDMNTVEDNISKREITKKAGAIDENNYIEGGQSDSSKIQGGPFEVNTESSLAQNSETTETNKQVESQTDVNEISSSKSAETSGSYNQSEQSSCNPDMNVVSDTKNQAEAATNDKMTKNENKRETNYDDLIEMDMSIDNSKTMENNFDRGSIQSQNDRDCLCSGNEDLTQLLDAEGQLHTSNNLYKRQVVMDSDIDLPDSVKSLEESFPNSNMYDDSGPYAGPLVRVKRTNPVKILRKRAAGLLPDAKVAFVPYRADDEDEDNDEGNEFEDDAFYERTSNLENSNIKSVEDETPSGNVELSIKQSKRSNDNIKVNQLSKDEDNLDSDTMSLGSDTDNVLSGVEGVDDNLMLSGGTRNRRDVDLDSNTDVKLGRPSLASSLENEIGKASPQSNVNVPNYQENDAFGPLPRRYVGDLGRYKRIRRLKQSHSAADSTDMS